MDVCALFVGLVVLLVVLWIIIRVVTWSTAVAGNIGNYRTGKAMKQISKQGLTVNQVQQYQVQQNRPSQGQSPQIRYAQGGGGFCGQCGRHTPPGSVACAYCGTRVSQPGQAKSQRRLLCVKCAKRLPLSYFLTGKNDTCKECEDKHARELAYERDREARRRSMAMSEVIARHPELRPKVMAQLGMTEFSGKLYVDVNSYEKICQWDKCVTRAKNLELARRYEDSAKEYEKLAMWKEAGEMRGKGSSTTVKHVNVDLNSLLERIRDGGLAIPFKCKSCGADISVDGNSNVKGLRFCSYCGTATDTETLTTILKDALK